jgi:hypothetical protein
VLAGLGQVGQQFQGGQQLAELLGTLGVPGGMGLEVERLARLLGLQGLVDQVSQHQLANGFSAA